MSRELAELRNLPDLYGPRWQGRRMTDWRPWPFGKLARMLWLASEGVDVWLPTTTS